jgi:hypothetical protein
LSRVCADDLDVAQAPIRDEFGCHSDVDRVSVDPDDTPARQDPLGQELDNAARSAADVNRAVARAQAKPIEQGAAIGCELVGPTLQAFALSAVTAQRIGRVWVAACPGTGRRVFSGVVHCYGFLARIAQENWWLLFGCEQAPETGVLVQCQPAGPFGVLLDCLVTRGTQVLPIAQETPVTYTCHFVPE